MALDWDILNENCSGIGDWTDNDDSGCSSTQVTFDGKSCFKFDSPSSAGNIKFAARERNITIPDTFTLETEVYLDSTSIYGVLYVQVETTSGHKYTLSMEDNDYHSFSLNKGTAGWHYVYTGDVFDRWITVRCVVKSGRKVDLWIDNRLYLANIVSDFTDAFYSNRISIYTVSHSSGDDALAYVNYIKMDSTPEAQTTESPLKIYGENIALRLAQPDTNATDEELNILKIQAKPFEGQPTAVCDVILVSTGDTNASKTRIYDGSTVKALMKLPT